MIAYAICFLPLALVSVRSALMQAQLRLEEIGRSLGLNWAPGAGPGDAAAGRPRPGRRGLALVFIAVVTELTATLLLAPIGTQTLGNRNLGRYLHLGFRRGSPLCGGAGGALDGGVLAAGAALRRCDRVSRPVP